MNFLKALSLVILALILQLTLVRIISIGAIKPDLVMVVLVGVSLRYGNLVGLYCGFLVGLVQDVYSIDTLGANILAKCLVGYAVGLFDERVLKIMPVTKVVFLALAFAVHEVVFALAARLEGPQLFHFLLQRSLPSGIYTLLVGSLVFYFLVAPARAEA